MTAATATRAEVPKPEYQPKRRLEDKMFNRLGKFGGVEKQWKEWDFNFQIILKSASSDLKVIFELMAGTTYSDTWAKEIEDKVKLRAQENNRDIAQVFQLYKNLSAEVFGQLCLITEGEAGMMVRGAADENGFIAWKKLSERYDSKSPQRMVRRLQGLMKPGEAKNVKTV